MKKSLFERNIEHLDFVNDFINLGYVYKKLGDYDNCLLMFKGALKLNEKIYQNFNRGNLIQFALVFKCLGTAYIHLGDYNTAIGYFKNALRINQTLYSHCHPQLAAINKCLGLKFFNYYNIELSN